MSRIVLKYGEIVSSQGIFEKDILIEGNKIVGVFDSEEGIEGEYEEIDCKDKLIFPGVIDCHVHFRDPGHEYKEDFESGSISAVSGGVTTVLDMPNNKPPTVSKKTLDDKRKIVRGRAYVNYGFYIGFNGKNFEEIEKCKNIAGIKVYIAHSTGKMGVSQDAVKKLFKNFDKQIVVHAEDEECIAKNIKLYEKQEELPASVHSKIRSPEAAALAVKYVCELAKKYERRVHIAHVSTEAELEIIEKYKKYGVTCEVTPHHLHLTEDDYEVWGNFIKANPPVRSRADVFALWQAVKSGVIDIIDTDHAPHTIEEKERHYLDVPSGIPGIEMLLPIFLNTVSNEGLSLSELALLLCERPAEIFKIKNKGKIKEGFDADLVIVDMEMEKTFERSMVKSKAGWSPYEGTVFKGWPVKTFVNGQLIYEDGNIMGKPVGVEVGFA